MKETLITIAALFVLLVGSADMAALRFNHLQTFALLIIGLCSPLLILIFIKNHWKNLPISKLSVAMIAVFLLMDWALLLDAGMAFMIACIFQILVAMLLLFLGWFVYRRKIG